MSAPASLSLRRVAGDALAAAIKAAVPALASCEAVYSDEEERKEAPSLRVLMGKLAFEPQQAVDVLATTGGGDLVMQIGEWSGDVELQLAANAAKEREQLEEAIFGLWLTDPERPGVYTLQLANAPAVSATGPRATLATVLGTFLLDSEAWGEERVFTKKRDSVLGLTIELPALLVAANVPEITTLQTIFDVLRGSAADDPAAAVEFSETVVVHDDGTISS